MSRTIAVLGAGAIGSMISADLTEAGLGVTVIDQWPAQVDAMKANGLHIQFRDAELRIHPPTPHSSFRIPHSSFTIPFLLAVECHRGEQVLSSEE